YCNQCGGKLDEDRATRDADGRVKLHADIAHPINSACREVIQSAVLKAFNAEKERSKQPGYVCTYDDFDSDYDHGVPQAVSDLGPAPRGYRTHGAHGSRGSHVANPTQETTHAARTVSHGHAPDAGGRSPCLAEVPAMKRFVPPCVAVLFLLAAAAAARANGAPPPKPPPPPVPVAAPGQSAKLVVEVDPAAKE